jgi:hypothetical protein
MNADSTRGEILNNPGFITRSEGFAWYGQVGSEDPRYVAFDKPENGIRAIARLLRGYQRRSGLRSVRAIVNRFAPGHRKGAAEYVEAIAEVLGVEPEAELNLEDEATMVALVAAIVSFENGRCLYDVGTLERGVKWAGA